MVTEKEKRHTLEILERIEEKRVEAKMPKMVLYERTGITSGAVAQWRSGLTKPSTRSLERIADCLGTTVQYLMYGMEKPADGGGQELQEFISIVSRLNPKNLAVLTATAQALLTAQGVLDGRGQSE